MIAFFHGAYRFLSNAWYAPVDLAGISYPTVEHAYQAARTADPRVRSRILTLSAAQARQLGRVTPARPNWFSLRLPVMEELVRQKFLRYPHLAGKLLETYPDELRNSTLDGDDFWGVDAATGAGRNHLGRILMKVRDDLLARQ